MAFDPQIALLDADFHDSVFAQDAAIARCLTSVESATIPRQVIAAGLTPVEPRIRACGAGFAGTGQVKLHVEIAPDGHATASVEATPDPWLGACIRSRLEFASFAKTPSGGSFTYSTAF